MKQVAAGMGEVTRRSRSQREANVRTIGPQPRAQREGPPTSGTTDTVVVRLPDGSSEPMSPHMAAAVEDELARRARSDAERLREQADREEYEHQLRSR
jgi:hypothetical protein